ncbi:unnamed protein product [Cuscuta campestris]|uniref:Methyltransferase type 11 domain-containing protein n=1 Tax=Cuscuta campestris TaxID=132261 RepID=A0A484MY10_9ASTE|nr:unnamed protein product [Cuscuta campestris]
MALGKGRSSGGGRRTSNTSWSSTVTPIAFVALCLLGVWLLSSTSVVPPRTTTRDATSEAGDGVASSVLNSVTSAIPKGGAKSPPAFEDHPGELPEDAIKSTDHDNEEAVKPQESATDSAASSVKDEPSDHDTEITDTVKPLDRETEITDTMKHSDKDKGTEITDTVKPSDRDTEINDSAKKDPVVVDHDDGDSDNSSTKKPEEDEKQIRRERKPENEKGEEIFPAKKGQEEAREARDVERENASVHQEETATTEENNKNMISDEDQQKRLEEQQQKEDDMMQVRRQSHHENHDETALPAVSDDEKAVAKTVSKKEWSTQVDQSVNQKERVKSSGSEESDGGSGDQGDSGAGISWRLCNVTAGPDYIPCLDNEEAIKKLRSRRHFEHRERHCPEEPPTCLVPLPKGYKKPIQWPQSRDKIWYHNVPHTLLAEVKGHQNWMKVSGEFLIFPGGGTQFIHGALHYIDFVQQAVPEIAWGKRTRVILDVGCGVASFGGYLFERDVLAMSFAPKDEHEAQIQFALERGIPAISAVMGSQRLPFPSGVFDIVHCARCRVPWHAEGGALLLELNRVLRPGGYFVWSATPVYQKLEEDVMIWKEMSTLTVAMCWELVGIKKDKLNSVGVAIYHKPDSNDCYDQRKSRNPPMCDEDDDPNAAWYVPLQACMHRVPTDDKDRGSKWPKQWPERLQTPPYWLNRSQTGIYGKPAPDDFAADYEHWKHVISKSYMRGLGINWSKVRNIMDMRADYGGFAAALKDLKVWVMNVVNVDSPDTLPIIYERGLFGIYHDWCESFSTYPRTYDLLHADHLFSRLKTRCKLSAVMAEVDRVVRPGGKFIMQDDSGTIKEVENLLKSLHWEVRMTFYQKQDGMLSAEKSEWRPETYAAPT